MVEQLTFNADGTYETFNPETGGTRESGTYSISADGKYRNMRPTGGPNYKCRIQFKGQEGKVLASASADITPLSPTSRTLALA